MHYINHKIIENLRILYVCLCVLETVHESVYDLVFLKQFIKCICSCVLETVQKVFRKYICPRVHENSTEIVHICPCVYENSSESEHVLVIMKQYRNCTYMSLFL